jgi:hypothetical protein
VAGGVEGRHAVAAPLRPRLGIVVADAGGATEREVGRCGKPHHDLGRLLLIGGKRVVPELLGERADRVDLAIAEGRERLGVLTRLQGLGQDGRLTPDHTLEPPAARRPVGAGGQPEHLDGTRFDRSDPHHSWRARRGRSTARRQQQRQDEERRQPAKAWFAVHSEKSPQTSGFQNGIGISTHA